jgi:hypothetical protein
MAVNQILPQGTEERRAILLARGVARALFHRGFESLLEFPLANGRRADVIALDGAGRFTIVEIKTSEADFRADGKWPEYLDFCDQFYFAVPEDFPAGILPAEHGLIVADAYGAEELRASADLPGLHPSRRRAQLLSFALLGAGRLQRLIDPNTVG